MIFKIFLFITGTIFVSYSLSIIILYLNLLNMGYDLTMYINLLFTLPELYLFFAGIIIIIFSFKKNKNMYKK